MTFDFPSAAPGIDLISRLADALGATVHDLFSVTARSDQRSVLLIEARHLFDSVAESANEASLSLLNQFLAMMSETRPRG